MGFVFEEVRGGYKVNVTGGGTCIKVPKYHLFRRVVELGKVANGITHVLLPDGVFLISADAFSECETLEFIGIPKTLVGIESRAFKGCKKLESFDADHTHLVSIGAHAFDDCKALSEVFLPDSVGSIGAWAFANCKSLTTFRNPSGNSVLEDSTFNGCSNLAKLSNVEHVSMGVHVCYGTKLEGVNV